MTFTYTQDLMPYRKLLDTPIKNCLCKHVMCQLDNNGTITFLTDKANKVWTESLKVGYNKAIWGFGDGSYKDYQFNRGFRIVIDSDGTPWIDNLHTAIRDILVWGKDVTIEEVDYYIIDMQSDTPIVVDTPIVSDSIIDIKGAINCGITRLDRITDNMKFINYTIEDFMKEHNINRSSMHISNSMIKNYKAGIL